MARKTGNTMGYKTSYAKMNKHPLNVAIIGMGGFAGAHHRAVFELEKKNILKLCCTCDIDLKFFKAFMHELKMEERNVKVFNNYISMLDSFSEKLDFAIIPTPIHLHAEMHKECVKRGIAVYLEKPPTLDYFELLDMIKTDLSAKKETNVGFNFIIQQLRQKIKKRILTGEFGKIQKITFLGMWPRPVSYFRRSSWAGRLILDDKLVLDSCFGNAISHYVHNILFWAGKDGVFSWDIVESAKAEIYRANNIQGTDTVFVLASTRNVPEIRIAMTHACFEKTPDIEKIYCEKATIFFEANAKKDEKTTQAKCEIFWKNGKIETLTQPNGNLLLENLVHYAKYVSGQKKRPLTRLTDAEPFVMLNGLIYIGAKKIKKIPQKNKEIAYDREGETYIVIRRIRKIAENFIENGLFPSQQNVRWAREGGTANRNDIGKLRQAVRTMIKEITQ
ncbi:MAG: Gfo/Idh/MocA family oxidoreductase [Candidatus Omnitrophica bacterium]|nr:Gfo/Idh/MocA family oxidoreductase [Candidatus Omnitrophota bacterium]MCM8817375.1 Gfo/Idh/MocA family oxidoreductase [Candidatus Omnitrophota bacterium]